MESPQWLATFQWVGGGVVTLLALFGVGKLFEIWFTRKLKKKDDAESVHATNQQHQFEYDSKFIQTLLSRVETLERKLEEVQKENLTQAVKGERVSAENEHLKTDNTRLQKRVEDLQQENKQQALKIINLENSNRRLESEVQDLKELVNSKLGK